MTNTEPDSEDIACAEYDRDTALGIKGYIELVVHPAGGADMQWVRGEPPKEHDGFVTIVPGSISVVDDTAKVTFACGEPVKMFPRNREDDSMWDMSVLQKYVGKNE